MRNFDMDSQYSDSLNLTISELCRDIPDTEKILSEETVYKKIKSSDGSGLINKLKTKLNFDVEKISENDKKEKFDMFRLLKYLYHIEKESSSESVRIIDILANPALDNIPSDFSSKSEYGQAYAKMYDIITNQIDNVQIYEEYLNQCDYNWNALIASLYKYVLFKFDPNQANGSSTNMDRINRLLNSVITKLGTAPKEIEPKEGIFKTFWYIIKCHEFLCNDCDKHNIYTQLLKEQDDFKRNNEATAISQEYIDKFNQFEKKSININDISKKDREFAKNHPLNKDFLNLIRDINYGYDVLHEDYKHYKFAFKYFSTVSKWYLDYHGIKLEKEGVIAYDTFIVIMQELVYIKKYNPKISNKYYGNKNHNKTLVSSVKSAEYADPISIHMWVYRIHNRVAYNFGMDNIMEKKRELEINIYKIKELIYSYRNFDDLKLVNDMVYRWVARSTCPEEVTYNQIYSLCVEINKRISLNSKEIRYIMTKERIHHLGIELINNDMLKQEMAEEISGFINFIAENQNTPDKTSGTVIQQTSSYSFVSNQQKYVLLYAFDYSSKHFYFNDFLEFSSDDLVERISKLGLKKFCPEKI